MWYSWSHDTIETSSVMSNLQFRSKFVRVLHLSSLSLGNPPLNWFSGSINKECRVDPFILNAAIPVGAPTRTLQLSR